jgi:hypothetical protein
VIVVGFAVKVKVGVVAVNVKVSLTDLTSVPLVPFIVIRKVPGIADVQDRDAVPEPVIAFGNIGPQVKLAGILSVKDTFPEKPFEGVTIIIAVAV